MVSGCAAVAAPQADPRLVSEWMRTLYGAIRVERLSPPVAARLMGYSTATLYTALAADQKSYPSLEGVLNGFPSAATVVIPSRANRSIVAATAERLVLDSLLREALPTTLAAVNRLADSLIEGQSPSVGTSRPEAGSIGTRIGLAIVAWAHGDGFDSTRGRPYTPPVGPAYWANDAPAPVFATQSLSAVSEGVALDNPANALRPGAVSDRALILSRPKRATKTLPAVNMAGTSEPYWGQLRPFVLTRWSACAVPPPPAYATTSGAAMYKDAAIVASTRKALTPEQKNIALYWADNAGESGTPVGHWISIASALGTARQLSAADAARTMLLTAVAQADAFIASWGYKYQYTLIRPRAYIRRIMDPSWEPLIPTPPFPEYPSAHSTQSAAAAEVLTALLGEIPFVDSTGVSIGNPPRQFQSFREAAHEAGQSRIYGGIHFPYGNLGGRALGECIGRAVIDRFHLQAR